MNTGVGVVVLVLVLLCARPVALRCQMLGT